MGLYGAVSQVWVDRDHPGWFYHNYCMLSSILFTLYFVAVAYVFYYMIRKDFFDND